MAIGKITSTQGNKGEVRIAPLTDFPQRFAGLSRVYLVRSFKGALSQGGASNGVYLWDKGTRAHQAEIENVRYHKRFVILKFKDCDSLSKAQEFKGLLVAIEKADRVNLPPDQYYIGDIIGLDVFNDEGKHLGKIQDTLRMPGNDVYVVRTVRGSKGALPPGDASNGAKSHGELLIPAIKQVVKQVDIAKGRMTVHLLKGLER